MSFEINIINRTLFIEDIESPVGRFLYQFWQNEAEEALTKLFSTSDFQIFVSPINNPTDYFSHSSKKLIENFVVDEENIEAYALIENGQESSCLVGTIEQGAHLVLEENVATIHYWGEGLLLLLMVNALIIEAIRLSGLVPLHAAAASFEGQGFLFLGKSGTGKTTTLLRAIKSGWSPLAEDHLLVDPETSMVYGWEKVIRLLPNSLKVLDEPLRSYDWGERYFNKYSLPYAELCKHYRTERTFSFELNHIVQLSRQENNNDVSDQWSKLSSAQVSASLWNSIGLPLSRKSQELIAKNVGKIVKVSTGWKLELGNISKPLATPLLSTKL